MNTRISAFTEVLATGPNPLEEIIHRFLTQQGCLITTVDQPGMMDLAAVCAGRPFDLFVIDFTCFATGSELMTKLRQSNAGAPIVVFSEPEMASDAKALGLTFISKKDAPGEIFGQFLEVLDKLPVKA